MLTNILPKTILPMFFRHRVTSLILSAVLSIAFLGSCSAVASTTDVGVTPLGSHEGEFCARDRALIFEDPSGLRILYDAGRTVAGAETHAWVKSMLSSLATSMATT